MDTEIRIAALNASIQKTDSFGSITYYGMTIEESILRRADIYLDWLNGHFTVSELKEDIDNLYKKA